MKNKKYILTLVFIICFISNIFPFKFQADSVIFNNPIESISNYEITPSAPIMRWKYKVINGRLHKRLYNYSENK